MATNEQAGMGNYSPKRMKYWSELTDQEKIERTRELLKDFQRQLQNLCSRIYSLEKHQHGLSGQILFEPDHIGHGGMLIHDPDSKDVYF